MSRIQTAAAAGGCKKAGIKKLKEALTIRAASQRSESSGKEGQRGSKKGKEMGGSSRRDDQQGAQGKIGADEGKHGKEQVSVRGENGRGGGGEKRGGKEGDGEEGMGILGLMTREAGEAILQAVARREDRYRAGGAALLSVEVEKIRLEDLLKGGQKGNSALSSDSEKVVGESAARVGGSAVENVPTTVEGQECDDKLIEAACIRLRASEREILQRVSQEILDALVRIPVSEKMLAVEMGKQGNKEELVDAWALFD